MTMSYCILIGDSTPLNVQEVIDATFAQIDSIYNNWNPDSEISKLNRLGAGEKIELSSELATFLHRIDALVRQTEGRFDPTVAPIKKELIAGALSAKKESIGWDKIHLEGTTFYKEHAETTLDLGGVAKGYAVDLLLENLGYENLYVEWGGEVRTCGKHPLGRPWKIAILGGAIVDSYEGALATSGTYYQQWKIGKKTYTHIIDPATQQPLSDSPIVSASVYSSHSCMEADALATSLMLFPSQEEALSWAKEHNLKIWLY